MKRLIIIGLVFGPALLMGQKRDDIVAIQRDLANLEDEVKQLKTAQDEKMAALQGMLQQAVDASSRVTGSITALQKEIDSKLSDQQNKLVAPIATVGSKVDQMADDLRSVSVNVADLMRKMDAANSKLQEVSEAVRTLGSTPVQPPPSTVGGATGVPGAPITVQQQVPGVNCDTSYQNAYRDYSTGKQELAMSEFNDVVKNCPGTDSAANAQYTVGYMYFTADQYSDAVKAFDVLLTFSENSKTQEGLYYKAVSLQKEQQLTKALATYKDYLSRYPGGEHVDQAKKNIRTLGGRLPSQSKK
jgi:TolA-binding protein